MPFSKNSFLRMLVLCRICLYGGIGEELTGYGKVEHKATLYGEHVVGDPHAHAVDLVFPRPSHGSPESKPYEPGFNLAEGVLLPLIRSAIAQRVGTFHELPYAGWPEIIYAAELLRNQPVALPR